MNQRQLRERFTAVRAQTHVLAADLSAEDCLLQSMPDASPVKWHLAHSNWFFQTFVVDLAAQRGMLAASPADPLYRQLFNSYYVGIGPCHPRPERGLISRPSLADIYAYRRSVDAVLQDLLDRPEIADDLLALVELGLHHEQQHQELILTDIKHHFSRNPALPVFRNHSAAVKRAPLTLTPSRFLPQPGGYADVGWNGDAFCFDNELPHHGVWLQAYAIANRPVSNSEYLAFIADGGYRRAELWLSDGWDVCRREAWSAPLYWRQHGSDWSVFTLSGEHALVADEPVCHVSFFEADAYARWSSARLCTEEEWERAAWSVWSESRDDAGGNFLDSGALHPAASVSAPSAQPLQMFGDVWEWTGSAYRPYPGYRCAAGATGEYNGKFMINQMVLRGGSCVTPRSHIRPSYRNFFPPAARWQFSGIRLAHDL